VAPAETRNRAARRLQKTSLPNVARRNGLQRLKARLLSWPLPHGSVDDLLDRHMVLNFAEKSLIFQQGAPGDVVYWLRAGLVDVISRDAKRGDVLVELAGPGELLGFMDVNAEGDGRSQIFTARARTRCEIGVLTRERISFVLDKLPPDVLVSLAEHINVWWSEKIERWVKFVRLNARERLESVLAELAEKCGVDDTRGRLIVPEFSHEDFASMIASSRPMVTRLLFEMVAQGHLLRRDRRYIICEGSHTNSRRSMA
jgi:CRP/FNR family cyclic AMP-dependent transcriptional regulator